MRYRPFADRCRKRPTAASCWATLPASGVPYTLGTGRHAGADRGGKPRARSIGVDWLTTPGAQGADRGGAAGQTVFNFAKQRPTPGQHRSASSLCCWLLMALVRRDLWTGRGAAGEMFPPRIRYSSMSIPYHIGTGYLRRLPAVDRRLYRGAHRRYLCRAVVHVGRWSLSALLVAWWGLPNGRRAILPMTMTPDASLVLPPPAALDHRPRCPGRELAGARSPVSARRSAGAAVKADAYGLGARRVRTGAARGRMRAISSSRTGAKLQRSLRHVRSSASRGAARPAERCRMRLCASERRACR